MANIYTNLKKKNTDDIVYPNISPAQNIPNGSITGGKLADNIITNDKIVNNTITNDKLASNTITNDKIANNTITNDKLASNTIKSDKLNFHLYNLHIKISCECDEYGEQCYISLNMIHTSPSITYAELKSYLSSKGYIDKNTAYSCSGRIIYQNFETIINGVSSAFGGFYVNVLEYVNSQLIEEKEISDISVTLTIDATQLF